MNRYGKPCRKERIEMEKFYSVAIDGPSGAGKSTIAKAAAKALAALAELQPVRTLSARTPARSISFLSFVISIPSSLFNHVRLSLYHKWRFDDETIVKFR